MEARNLTEDPALAPATHFDVAVIGGGPAGLTAATHCALKGLRTVVFEGKVWGGVPGRVCPKKFIEYYPGMTRKVSGEQLSRTWVNGATEAGVNLLNEGVIGIDSDKTLHTTDGIFTASTLILATGSRPILLGVPGEKEFSRGDKGVYYSVAAPERFMGKRVVIVGGGDSAVDAAAMLLGRASRITLVHRGPELRALTPARQALRDSGELEILLESKLDAIVGGERVLGVRLVRAGTGETVSRPADAVILAVGVRPASQMYRELGIAMDQQGRVKTDRSQRTNLPGVLAVGDLASDVEMIVVAAAQGAIAAHHAYTHLRRPYWARNGRAS